MDYVGECIQMLLIDNNYINGIHICHYKNCFLISCSCIGNEVITLLLSNSINDFVLLYCLLTKATIV